MRFCDRIRLRREELNLSQDELAKRMGYKSRSTINKIELGINDVSQSKIIAFAKALNTTVGYLMGDDDALFGKRLKELREKSNYSMDKFIELYNQRFDAKMNKSTLSRYENGLQDPIYTVVVNLAEFFGVSVDFLSGGIDNTVSNNITFDDFTYAMHNEAKELTEKDKEMLLNMARMLRERINDDKTNGGLNGSSK